MTHHVLGGVVSAFAITLLAGGTAWAGPAMTSDTAHVQLRHAGVSSSDPLMRELRLRARHGNFYLTGTQEREIVTNTADRPLSVCLSNARDVGPMIGWKATNAVPLAVSWNGGSAVVKPGECVHVQAARAVLRPAAQVPAGVALSGRVTAGSDERI